MNMHWEKLIECQVKAIGPGAILRLKAVHPYEDLVDFLVFNPMQKDYGLGLVVSSGYRSGLVKQYLPISSMPENVLGIERTWLIGNWSHWVYPECPVEEVYVCLDGYPVPFQFPPTG